MLQEVRYCHIKRTFYYYFYHITNYLKFVFNPLQLETIYLHSDNVSVGLTYCYRQWILQQTRETDIGRTLLLDVLVSITLVAINV